MKRTQPDEKEAFRLAMADVTPLAHRTVERTRPRPRPEPRFSEADEREALQASITGTPEPEEFETGEQLWYARDGVPVATLRRLRRGHYAVGAVLDLHGLTTEAARIAVATFIERARMHGIRCVRIIHGKGLGSGPRGPVLKRRVALWLRRRTDVLAYSSARPADGGTGAVYVLLKR
ncbi:MAG TPA: Smr/MutS family protein [Gammaproteobacteria bacterium]|nr:Smr/MutS family protein [Gammaproteobacteria bacterium]